MAIVLIHVKTSNEEFGKSWDKNQRWSKDNTTIIKLADQGGAIMDREVLYMKNCYTVPTTESKRYTPTTFRGCYKNYKKLI